MAGTIDKRLKELGITLPAKVGALGNYVPFVLSGNLVFSVQAPLVDGKSAYRGRVGAEYTLEEGQACARMVAVNLIGQLRDACDGDLDRVRRCIRLGGFIAVAPGFDKHSQVMNGASDLIVEVFGDRGRHTRFALGLVSLPLEMTVNIEGVFEIAPKRAASARRKTSSKR